MNKHTQNSKHRGPRWIWLDGQPARLNDYAAFRLIVRAPDGGIPSTVPITVSASSQYRLWVNSQPVGRGPAREWLGAVGIDRHDIAPFLLPGENVLSALVHNAGEDTNAFQKTPPGFFLAGAVAGRDLSTGRAPWEALRPGGWSRDSTRMHVDYKRFNEAIDMRRYCPETWERGQGGGWRPATPTDAVDALRPVRVPRDIPPLRESDLPHSPRLVGLAAWRPRLAANETPAQALMGASRRRAPAKRVLQAPAGLPLTVRPGAPLSLVFDLGEMTSGVLSLEIEAGGGETLAIGYGDRLVCPRRAGFAPADGLSPDPCGNAGAVVNATHGGNNSVDRLLLAPGRNAWQGAFNSRGFRFVQFDLSGLTRALVIRDVRARAVVYPCEPRGAFACSDPRLNALWEAGRRTLQLCMADTYLDNPSRERQQYGEDGLIDAFCGYHYFGDTGLAARFLRIHAGGLHADGSMESGGPWPFRQIIPAWSLLWMEAIGNHLDYTGDDRIGIRLAPAVRRALRWFDAFEDAEGLLNLTERPHRDGKPAAGVLWNFIDWQPDMGQVRGEPAHLALNAIYYGALRTAARILRLKYGARAAAGPLARRERLGWALRRRLEQQGAACGEHALAYASWAGLTSVGLDAIAARALAGNLETDAQFMFFTLAALEQAGRSDAVVAALRHGLGPMLDWGCGTLAETYDAHGQLNRAVCQGIAAVPGCFLPRTVGGIRLSPLRERTVTVAPWAGDLAWARATVPTPEGPVSVFWDKDHRGGIRLALTLPNRRWKARLAPVRGAPVAAMRIAAPASPAGAGNQGSGCQGSGPNAP